MQPAIELGRTVTSSPSPSPKTAAADLSVSAHATQMCNKTEPGVEASHVTNASSGVVTPERSRQKAEILKLRLGLARYKVRTGQIDVPLEHLRIVPAAYDLQRRQQLQPQALASASRAVLQKWSAGDCARQHSEQADAGSPSKATQQSQTPRHWYLSCSSSPSTGDAEAAYSQSQGRGCDQDNGAARSSSDEKGEMEDDEDRLDPQSLPRQPQHELDAVDVIEDSDVSHDASGRKDNDGEETDDDSDLPQLPQIRQLSPIKKAFDGKQTLLGTPRGNSTGKHLDHLTSSAMRGSAINGLLSLARS
ncbi:hypothetical protein SEPCBS119000_002119 [Sporothrix epigloea]|uniref:Uncharacterized protein n=1 Tax=Sporothrix epigloea TaxID=1892477 RepID=A0ABP0DEE7_9PEZI